MILLNILLLLDQEPGGGGGVGGLGGGGGLVNLAEKVTNFDMVSNDLHI